ncbi:unnamed protein product, partial [Urochloa humidicola]
WKHFNLIFSFVKPEAMSLCGSLMKFLVLPFSVLRTDDEAHV